MQGVEHALMVLNGRQLPRGREGGGLGTTRAQEGQNATEKREKLGIHNDASSSIHVQAQSWPLPLAQSLLASGLTIARFCLTVTSKAIRRMSYSGGGVKEIG